MDGLDALNTYGVYLRIKKWKARKDVIKDAIWLQK